MATPPRFPYLPGVAFDNHKIFNAPVQRVDHVSGRITRRPLYSRARYEFTIVINGLDETGAIPGLGVQSMQALADFYLYCQTTGSSFLYHDPSDYYAIAQPVGTGDGVTTQFVLTRTTGRFSEPVPYALQADPVTVAGVVTNAFTLVAPNLIVFATAPGAGAAIVADILFNFECEFPEDSMDLRNILAGVWDIQTLKFRSLK